MIDRYQRGADIPDADFYIDFACIVDGANTHHETYREALSKASGSVLLPL